MPFRLPHVRCRISHAIVTHTHAVRIRPRKCLQIALRMWRVLAIPYIRWMRQRRSRSSQPFGVCHHHIQLTLPSSPTPTAPSTSPSTPPSSSSGSVAGKLPERHQCGRQRASESIRIAARYDVDNDNVNDDSIVVNATTAAASRSYIVHVTYTNDINWSKLRLSANINHIDARPGRQPASQSRFFGSAVHTHTHKVSLSLAIAWRMPSSGSNSGTQWQPHALLGSVLYSCGA